MHRLALLAAAREEPSAPGGVDRDPAQRKALADRPGLAAPRAVAALMPAVRDLRARRALERLEDLLGFHDHLDHPAEVIDHLHREDLKAARRAVAAKRAGRFQAG